MSRPFHAMFVLAAIVSGCDGSASGPLENGGDALPGGDTPVLTGDPDEDDVLVPDNDQQPGDLGPGLAKNYPLDNGIEAHAAVLFHSGFENGLSGWTEYTEDQNLLSVKTSTTLSHSGTKYLQSSVTKTQLEEDEYVDSMAQLTLPDDQRVERLYWRFYARIVGNSATPHHWVRVAAGTPEFYSDGLANTVPAGNAGFWYDLDAHDDGTLSFYAYWYKMRSGRCNDGSATPGCAGDQGTTYYYGNNYSPAGQTDFVRDAWMCIEVMTKANTVGTSDGALTLWVNDALVGTYEPGTPRGRFLRDNFFTWGPYYSPDTDFPGFDFRSHTNVLLKRVTLDNYYERGSLAAREDNLGVTFPEAQVILYDDVVLATERIGCQLPQ